MDENQVHCMEIAGPILYDFHDAWHGAMTKYLEYPSQFIAEHDDSTAASCVRSHMWMEVVRRFDGRRGFALLRLRGLNVLNYRDQIV